MNSAVWDQKLLYTSVKNSHTKDNHLLRYSYGKNNSGYHIFFTFALGLLPPLALQCAWGGCSYILAVLLITGGGLL